MQIFGPDPKDEVIQLLKDERDHLRARIAELEKQFLALTSTHAFRLVHGQEDELPAKPIPPDPYTLRSVDHVPEFNLAAVEASFRSPRED